MRQHHSFYFRPCSLLILAVLLALLSSCRTNPKPPVIRLGLAINLSGRGGLSGEDIRDGALLAIEQINRKGGVNGKILELLARDDGNTAQGIQAADEDLIAKRVTALIGHSTSGNTLIAYPIVTSHDILLITPYAATNRLTGKDDLFFRTQVNRDLYGKKTAELFQRRNVGSVSVLLDMSNRDFVVDWRQSLQRYFSGSIFPVPFHSDQPVSWSTLIKQLLAPRPDAVLLLTEASMTGVALQKLAATGFSGQRYATVWADTPKLFRYAARHAEGLSIITFIDPENSRPAYKAFSRVMDDEEMLRKLAASQLSILGHQPVMTEDGAEAVNRYQELQDKGTPVDVVILDLTVPGGMGGREAGEQLLAVDPRARIIVTSGYSNDPVMAAYQKHGFKAALEKPFHLRELSIAVAKALAA